MSKVGLMPRKRKKLDADSGQEGASKQLSFRVPMPLAIRIDTTAQMLGLDPSNFLRMVLLECLPIYEERGQRIAERKTKPDIKPEA